MPTSKLPKMKSLCVDARMLHSGGIGTFLKSLLPGLAARFELSLLHLPSDAADLAEIPAKLIQVKSPIYSAREQWELPRKIPRCDIFWSPHFNIPLFPIRACKRLTTLNDTYHLAHFSSLSLPKKCYAKLFYNAALAYADHVTTISDFSHAQITKYCRIEPKALTRIYDGVALEPVEGIPSYLLAFSGKPHKNITRVKKAAERTKHPLVIADGTLPDAKMPALYAGARLLVFPSLYEGFGYPPLEAMAAGVPVITSRAGSLLEICGDAAEYVDPYDIGSIAEAIERLLTDDTRRQELIAKGKKRAAYFSVERCLTAYHSLMETL